MKMRIFLGAFLLSCLAQGLAFFNVGIVDKSFWSNQAKYVETSDPEQFNANYAYGHPGGPIIYGTIAIHHLGISYDNSLMVFLTIFNSIILACIATLCASLRPGIWWLASVGILAFDRLFSSSTPPSAIVSLLLVLLAILTLRMYEKGFSTGQMFLWTIVAGLAVATRTDISSFSLLFFLFILKPKMSWNMIFRLAIGAFFFFAVFNPYMWYMPFQHMTDLVGKVIYHYEEFAPTPMRIGQVVSISSLAFLSIGFTLLYYFLKKRLEPKLPPRFAFTILAETILLYGIFLSARYQAVRYFIPIIFIWQTFLPLYLFDLLPKIRFSFLSSPTAENRARNILAGFMMFILIGSELYFLLDNVFLF